MRDEQVFESLKEMALAREKSVLKKKLVDLLPFFWKKPTDYLLLLKREKGFEEVVKHGFSKVKKIEFFDVEEEKKIELKVLGKEIGLFLFSEKDGFYNLDEVKSILELFLCIWISTSTYEELLEEYLDREKRLHSLERMGVFLKGLDSFTISLKFLELSLDISNAEVGIFVQKENGKWKTLVEWGISLDELLEIKDGEKSLIDYVIAKKSPFILKKSVELSTKRRVYNALFSPVFPKEGSVGVLCLINKKDGEFLGSDEKIIDTLSDFFAIALSNTFLHQKLIAQQKVMAQLKIAREIQLGLLPKDSMQTPIFELCAVTRPATTVGGDFYDFFWAGDKSFVAFLGDVCGKGIGAALLMAMTRSVLRTVLKLEGKFDISLSLTNNLLCEEDLQDNFITLLLVKFGRYFDSFSLMNAGHNPPLLYQRETDTFIELKEGGVPLGIFPNMVYPKKRVPFLSGDILVMFTDGVIEAKSKDGEEFGINRICDVIRSTKDKSAKEIKKKLMHELDRFCKDTEPYDDETLLIVKKR